MDKVKTPKNVLETLAEKFPVFEFKNTTNIAKTILLRNGDSAQCMPKSSIKLPSELFIQFPNLKEFMPIVPSQLQLAETTQMLKLAQAETEKAFEEAFVSTTEDKSTEDEKKTETSNTSTSSQSKPNSTSTSESKTADTETKPVEPKKTETETSNTSTSTL